MTTKELIEEFNLMLIDVAKQMLELQEFEKSVLADIKTAEAMLDSGEDILFKPFNTVKLIQ